MSFESALATLNLADFFPRYCKSALLFQPPKEPISKTEEPESKAEVTAPRLNP